MKIVSIQVGRPKTIESRGRSVTTGIFKSPVHGPVMVKKLNLVGDQQADLTVHGGENKAVYAYSVDAYPFWRSERPNDKIAHGAFGENLSVDALPEDQICIGDTFEIGDAVLQAVQPRFPCYKLGVKFNDPKILRTFMQFGRPGVYFKVLKEGLIDQGDEFTLIAEEKEKISIARLFAVFRDSDSDPDELAKLLKIKALPPEMRQELASQLGHLN